MTIMKTLLLSLIVALGLAFPAESSENDLFVVLTSNDAETQMMAMVLATQSVNQDVNVRVLLCSSAGELAVKGTEFPAFAPTNRSPKQLLIGLIEQGIVVEVCGIFLPGRDYDESDLIEGAGIASPPEVAEYMKNDGVRYFTF
jgi:predicted peroxiredoxin